MPQIGFFTRKVSAHHRCHAAETQHLWQVSFGVHDEEERAGRMYDRAIIVERGRSAKTNFPLHDYEQEIADFEAFVEAR